MENQIKLSKPQTQLNLTSTFGWIGHDYNIAHPTSPTSPTTGTLFLPERMVLGV